MSEDSYWHLYMPEDFHFVIKEYFEIKQHFALKLELKEHFALKEHLHNCIVGGV